MRISGPGNDRGNAVFTALAVIFSLSAIYVSIVPGINAALRLANETRINVMHNIEQSNLEVIEQYDLD